MQITLYQRFVNPEASFYQFIERANDANVLTEMEGVGSVLTAGETANGDGERANGYGKLLWGKCQRIWESEINKPYLWHLRPQAPSVFMAFTTADSVSYWSSEADTRSRPSYRSITIRCIFSSMYRFNYRSNSRPFHSRAIIPPGYESNSYRLFSVQLEFIFGSK
jgi:hypothetical protein